jgi:acyl-CoA reductase-like NAD-dependent aldehyde dehydrogenase
VRWDTNAGGSADSAVAASSTTTRPSLSTGSARTSKPFAATRRQFRIPRAGRDIKAGRVWTNCYHAYPAHAAFGGYKQSGIGRETHKMMLDHYQQTKNLLVSYSNKAQGFF